ncbi:hypothetical protein KUL49_22390 [Alteromonas sp. KUL49]|nr:hypothetical protein KUL49_22390 [Alteromonas sp. KUL49]
MGNTGNVTRLNGYSLMECLIATSLVLISSALAAPSLSSWFEKQDLKNALIHTALFIKQARNEAIAQSMSVNIVVDPSREGCIGATLNTTCDCFAPSSCEVKSIPRSIQFEKYNTSVRLSVPQKIHMQWDKLHGFVDGPGFTVGLNNNEHSGKVIISTLGRVRFCSEQVMLGIAPC